MTNRRRGGVCNMWIDGVLYSVAPDVKCSHGKETREEVLNSSSLDGYIGKPSAPVVEGNFIDREELDLDAVADMTDVEVIVEQPNGKTFALYHAISMNPDGISVNMEDGKSAFKFVGTSSAII